MVSKGSKSKSVKLEEKKAKEVIATTCARCNRLADELTDKGLCNKCRNIAFSTITQR